MAFFSRTPNISRWPFPAILAACVLLALLCDGFAFYVVWTNHRDAIHDAENDTRDLARVLEALVRNSVQGVDLILSNTARAISDDPSLIEPGGERLTALLRQQRMIYPAVGGIAVIASNGSLVADTQGNGGPGRSFNFADRSYLAAFRANPDLGLYIDEPRVGRVRGRSIVGVARAWRDRDGTFRGIVYAPMTAASLHKLFAAANIGRTGAIALIRDDGVVLARLPDDSVLVGRSLGGTTLFAEHLRRAASGTFESAGIADGIVRQIAYARVSGLPLVIAVARGNAEVLTAWRRQAWTYGAGALVANLLILGLGGLLNREISRRERSENTIRERERLIRLVADNVPMLIAYVDKNRVYRFVNQVAAHWMNQPITAFAGRHVEDVLPPAMFERSRERIEAALAGTHLAFEERRRYPDGVERWADVTYVPVREGSDIGGYIVLVSDIGDRKAAEEQLREREDQLRQAQKMEVLGQLTGGIAHDFNNLLGVIVGNLDLLAMNLVDRIDLEPVLTRAIDAVERGGTLTRQLLAFSRKQMLQPQSIDVAALLADLAALLRRTLGDSVTVATAAEKGLWPCCADRHQLETALLNLALNARDAMPKGGQLVITASNFVIDEAYARGQAEVVPGDYVAIAVRDDGTGMTAEIAGRAFEPFFTTKEVGKGSGLGLSMVYGFCKQSGGHVRLYSEPGAGTTVTLYLPRSAAAPDRADTPPPPPAHGKGQRILVVEDNAPLRQVAVTMLTYLGYATVEAESAEAALERLAATPDVTLLFTDIMLGAGMSGFELAAEARRRRPGLKVLYTSGHPNLNALGPDGRSELPAGAVIVAKPFRVADLARHVGDVLKG